MKFKELTDTIERINRAKWMNQETQRRSKWIYINQYAQFHEKKASDVVKELETHFNNKKQ